MSKPLPISADRSKMHRARPRLQFECIALPLPGGGAHEPEFVEWRWEPMQNLPDLVVPFKRGVYERVVAEFGKFAAR